MCFSFNELQKILEDADGEFERKRERRHAQLAVTSLGQDLLKGIDEPWLRELTLWEFEAVKEERPDLPDEDIAYLVRSAEDEEHIDEHVDDFWRRVRAHKAKARV